MKTINSTNLPIEQAERLTKLAFRNTLDNNFMFISSFKGKDYRMFFNYTSNGVESYIYEDNI